ncbi:protein of unknown function [Ruminococcaceae bacterium BL-6]|nr:protein of unknown function [Ruminococcaceae bacterium BL-6]
MIYHFLQYGGPNGELGASLRYLSQRYVMPYPELKAILTDVGTEVPKCAFRSAERERRGSLRIRKSPKGVSKRSSGLFLCALFERMFLGMNLRI